MIWIFALFATIFIRIIRNVKHVCSSGGCFVKSAFSIPRRNSINLCKSCYCLKNVTQKKYQQLIGKQPAREFFFFMQKTRKLDLLFMLIENSQHTHTRTSRLNAQRWSVYQINLHILCALYQRCNELCNSIDVYTENTKHRFLLLIHYVQKR